MDLALGARFEFCKNVALSERLFTHTLQYVQTVFGGLKERNIGENREGQKQWEKFLHDHRVEISRIFKHIGQDADRSAIVGYTARHAYREAKELQEAAQNYAHDVESGEEPYCTEGEFAVYKRGAGKNNCTESL